MIPAVIGTNLFFAYHKSIVIEEGDFVIPHGQFVAIIGPNGGGKTTLLKLLLGFLTPTKGKLLLHGASAISMRKKIGYVPQLNRTDRDFPITVLELVMLGAIENKARLPQETKEKALYWIEELGLIDYKETPFSFLSGGLAQRALLARSLVSDPTLLFLDESTANVDKKSKDLILEKLSSFKGKKTILFVTHDFQTIAERVDQILCVDKKISCYLPSEICQHVSMGLYHGPLTEAKKRSC